MATIGTYDNVVNAGVASITATAITGGATAYEVRDGDGTVIATGPVAGTSVTIPAPNGSWPPGWSLVSFLSEQWNAAYGYVTDTVQVTAIRTGIAPLPGVPAAGTDPNAGDPSSRGIDTYLHGFTLIGPQRWQIHDVTTPNSAPPTSTTQGSTIDHIAANIELDAAVGYTSQPDPARPRPQFVQIPTQRHTASGYAAGVAEVVESLGPSSEHGVVYFEGLNEPQGEKGLSVAESAAQYVAFRAAVKASHPDALAMGPVEVCYAPDGADTAFNPKVSALAQWLNLIQPGSLDAFSVHDYNAYNGDFLVTDAWLGALRDALADAGYPDDLPMFLTENSTGPAWQMLDVRRMIQWAACLYFAAERVGVPKEHIYWFMDTEISGFEFPNWLKETTGDLRPLAAFFRAYSEEVHGKAYADALDLGEVGNRFYRGNIYRGEAGTCLAVYAQGNPDDSITLAVSDAGPITVVDWQGRASTRPVIRGRVTVPIGDTPTYVRFSPGCTLSVVDVGHGLAAPAENIAPDATVTSSRGSAHLERITDGGFQTGGYLPGPDFVYKSDGLEALTFTWATPQRIAKILIRQVAPWMNYNGSCAMTRGRLEYWNGSGWLPCPTVPRAHWDARGRYANDTTDTFVGRAGDGSFMPTWYDNNWCHNVDLAVPIKTTQLRWTVTETSRGTVPNADAAAFVPFGYAGFPNAQQRVMVSELLVLRGAEREPGRL